MKMLKNLLGNKNERVILFYLLDDNPKPCLVFTMLTSVDKSLGV